MRTLFVGLAVFFAGAAVVIDASFRPRATRRSTTSVKAPVPCNSPDQWEAAYEMYDPTLGHQFVVRGRYSYDKLNLRKRRFEAVEEGHSEYQFLEVIELFLEEKRYVIDMRTRECHEEPLYRPGEPLHGFRPHDVPAGATSRGTTIYGSRSISEGYLEVSDWVYRYVDRDYYWEGSFTLSECVPLRSDEFNSTTFGARFQEFYDVTVGISDPNVFIPPASCRG